MPSDNRHNGGPPIDDETVFGRDGWIAIARAMRDHHLVGFGRTVEPADESRGFVYSRSEAWIDLIMECRYTAGVVMNGGKRMTIEPGQLLGATSWLANRWNWSPKTVRGFLEKLQADGMIERTTPGIQYTKSQIHPGSDENYDVNVTGRPKGTQAQVITICKYEDYQVSWRNGGHAQGHAEGTQGARQGHAKGNTLTKEEGNKETTEEKNTPPPPTVADAPRDGEECVGAGVFVNGETVRHRAFTLSIEAIAMQLATTNIGVSTAEARQLARTSAIAHALQWATEINAGKLSRDVVPSNPANFIRGSVVAQRAKGKLVSKTPSYMQRY